MVSTYLSYDLIVRDIKVSLGRVGNEQQVARDAAYYKENIGKVKTVEEFLADDRLYSYAMTAHGLEDMIYAKGFMKQVLASDLSDPDSYASRLTDDRYRDFAAAFTFSGGGVPVAQSETQIDEMIGLYTANIDATGDAIQEETRYYNIMIDRVGSVDELLNNDRMRAYVFTVFGIDENNYSRATIKSLMSSDLNDPASYINTVWGTKLAEYQAKIDAVNAQLTPANVSYTADAATRADLIVAREQPGADQAAIDAQLVTIEARMNETAVLINSLTPQLDSPTRSIAAIGKYYDLAAAFEFNADGTTPAGLSAQTADLKKLTNQQYILSNPRVTPAAALLNDEYVRGKIATATTVTGLLADPRVYSYIKTTFGLTSAAIVPSTVEFILTSDRDPNNAASYVNTSGANKEAFRALLDAFNFQTDGTLAAGVPAQTAAQSQLTSGRYMSAYNDNDDAADALAIKQYQTAIAKVASVKDLLLTANSAAYNFALKAVGLDPTKESALTIKNVLKSDLNDPKSYVYKLKDERYLALAKAFNFDAKGQITEPLSAQSPAAVTEIAKEYIVQMTRFASADEKTSLRAKADAEAEYYEKAIPKIDKVADLLADRRVVNVVLVSKGIDPETVTDEDLKKMFASDLDDPKSFVNAMQDERFSEVVASFNFDVNGNLVQSAQTGIQQRGEILETEHRYLHMMLETEQGNENAGVRLALYFERMAGSVTTAYDILGDTALLEVFRTAFSLPTELSSMDIDQQAKIVEQYLTLDDLKDPEKVKKLVQRFTIMYDLENSSSTSSPLTILLGGGASASISADTLMAISQLRNG